MTRKIVLGLIALAVLAKGLGVLGYFTQADSVVVCCIFVIMLLALAAMVVESDQSGS